MKLIGIFILVFVMSVAIIAYQGSDRVLSSSLPFKDDPISFVRASGDGRYHPLYFSGTDLYYMTEALYFEAVTEPEECQMLVIEVILNRKQDKRWDSTVKAVIWAKYQFSYTNDGKSERMRDLDARKRLEKLSARVLGGNSIDKSDGALYYYNPKLADPDWDWEKISKVVTCGDHDFYKDKQTVTDF